MDPPSVLLLQTAMPSVDDSLSKQRSTCSLLSLQTLQSHRTIPLLYIRSRILKRLFHPQLPAKFKTFRQTFARNAFRPIARSRFASMRPMSNLIFFRVYPACSRTRLRPEASRFTTLLVSLWCHLIYIGLLIPSKADFNALFRGMLHIWL